MASIRARGSLGLAAGLALAASGALVAVPAAADAARARARARPTVRLEARLPARGHAAFTHAVFRARPPRAARGGRARSSARSGSRAAPRVRVGVTARVRNRGRLPRNLIVLARVADVLRRRNTFAADVLVINSSRGPARSAHARASQDEDEQLQPGDEIEIDVELELPDGTIVRGTFVGTVLEDRDIDGNDPPHADLCRQFFEPAFSAGQLHSLFNPVVDRLSRQDMRSLFGLAEDKLCDRSYRFDPERARQLLEEAGWIDDDGDEPAPGPPPPPPGSICSGDLGAAPYPFEASEFEVTVTCSQTATSLGFELPGGRQATNLLAPPQLPACLNQQLGDGRFWVHCAGGILPPNTPTTLRVHPTTQLGGCDRVKLYFNPPSGTPNAAVTDTDAFATCP